MPTGRFQIKRISPAGSADSTYQISHESKHGEFYTTVDRTHLNSFLREKLRISESSVEHLLRQVDDHGHVVVDDAELSESDMASAGMQYV